MPEWLQGILEGMNNTILSYPFTADYEIGPPLDLRRATVYPRKVVEARAATIEECCLNCGGPFILRGNQAGAGVILDLGEERVGYLRLRIQATAACTLNVFYGEVLEEARRSEPFPAGWYTLPTDEFRLLPGTSELASRGRRAFRFLRLVLDAVPANVTVQELTLETVEYPLEPRGRFRCSNPRLNSAWDIACRTTRLCMQQFYEDGVKRDGLLWIGDYRVQFLCNVGAFGNAALARRSLLMMAASQRSDGALPGCAGRGGGHQHPHNIEYMPGIPAGSVDSWIIINYCADYLCAVEEFYTHTGDRPLLELLQPCLRRLVRFLSEDFNPFSPDLMRTPYCSFEMPTFFADNCCAFSSRATLYAQLVAGFGSGKRLAELLGDDPLRITCQKARETLAAAFREQCLDPVNQALRDETNLKDSPHAASWCAAAWAVLSGLLPTGEAARRALLSVMADPHAVTPVNGYTEFFFLDALFSQGLAAEALEEMEVFWGAMLDYGLTTCSEGFNRNSKNHFEDTLAYGAPGSFCHGWSAAPAYLLPARVLGITPVEPGYRTVRVQPALGNLEWAEGEFPTPHGPIRARWERTGDGTKGNVQLPNGISAIRERQ